MATTATKEKTKKEAPEKMKYGVEDVAEGLGIEPASARVQLRNHNVKKAGKSYGWNSKGEVEEVVKKIKAGSDRKKDSAKVTKLKPAKAKVEKKVEKKVAAS